MKNNMIFSTILALGFIFLSVPLVIGQESKSVVVERTINKNYTRIGAGGKFNVILKKGKVGKVMLDGHPDLIERIKDMVIQSTLIIYVPRKTMQDFEAETKEKGIVTITIFIDTVERIGLEGGSDITYDGTLTTDTLRIRTKGASSMQLTVQANSIDIEGIENSLSTLTGKVNKIVVVGEDSAKIDVQSLLAQEVKVKASDDSNIIVYADNTLDIKASNNAIVQYKGKVSGRALKISKKQKAQVTKIAQ